MAAKGFGKTSPNKNTNYKTLFEQVQEKAGGEEQTWTWYRKTVRTMALNYKENPSKTIKDEKRDRNDPDNSQDQNVLRRYAKQGRLFLFEYKAKMKYLPYYDTFPLVYVISANKDHFFGANLHYLHPKKRSIVISKLKDNKIDIPRVCFHKYITDHINGFLLDLALDEWDTAINLPVEQFVKNKGDILVPYKSSEVWEETNKQFNVRIKAKRIVKGYGNPEDIEVVT